MYLAIYEENDQIKKLPFDTKWKAIDFQFRDGLDPICVANHKGKVCWHYAFINKNEAQKLATKYFQEFVKEEHLYITDLYIFND